MASAIVADLLVDHLDRIYANIDNCVYIEMKGMSLFWRKMTRSRVYLGLV